MGRPIERLAILGTGLLGTSIALAASRAGCQVEGWDLDGETSDRAGRISGLKPRATLEETVYLADLVVVATPIASVAETVVRALEASSTAIVTDVASVKGSVVADVRARSNDASGSRFVPGHPMGGSERSGPEHASASVVDGIVWVIAADAVTDPAFADRLAGWVASLGARPVRLEPEHHDRLVAIVSHLPQIASSSLMGVAAVEEAEEPEILLLAAGGFRDLTRLAASQPALWSEILLANKAEVGAAIDLFVGRLLQLRADIEAADARAVEATFGAAKAARLGLATKPTVRSGVAVWQVEIPDEPGALARITAVLADGDVNIEDLQIVHSPEGGRGTVHLTVAAAHAASTASVLATGGYDPTRLA
jgi:prephenate dehydrogenase